MKGLYASYREALFQRKQKVDSHLGNFKGEGEVCSLREFRGS
jgi:hypothetical protein